MYVQIHQYNKLQDVFGTYVKVLYRRRTLVSAGRRQLDICDLDLVVSLHAGEIEVFHPNIHIGIGHARFNSELGTRSACVVPTARDPFNTSGRYCLGGML